MELADGEDHCKEQRQAAGVDENGLPQRAPEELVKLRVALHGYHARIGGHLGRSPAVRKGLDAREGSERHTHLTGYNGTVGGKQHRVEQLEDEVTADPTQGYLPLKRKNLLDVRDFFNHLLAKYLMQNAAERRYRKGKHAHHHPRQAVDGRRHQFGTASQAHPHNQQAQTNLVEPVFGHFLHLAQPFEKGKHGCQHQVDARSDRQDGPGKAPSHRAARAVVTLEEHEAHYHQHYEQDGSKRPIPAEAEVEQRR